jgi:ribosomal protein L11 methyltransferase
VVSTLLRLSARVEGEAAAMAVAALLDEVAETVSVFESGDEDATWSLAAYSRAPLLDAALEIRLALAAAAHGGALLALGEERLASRDWVALNRLAFPARREGRFWIHGSHDRRPVPPGLIAIEIDATTAFGTGEHASTRGCLMALELLARRRRMRRPLDIGTGTGILAIAAAKLLRASVRASDIDREAVRVARHNLRRNGVAPRVRLGHATGYRSRTLGRVPPDLVFANILARPLVRMAGDLARVLAPGGRAVLSGLLARQAAFVLAAHRARGLVLEARITIEGWSTLVLRRPPDC